jgi:uncharacterized membrane protein SpoIIM required for sporulation
MRETQFIEQNQDKWREFEQTLEGEARDADQLRDLFVQITDDLSYSRTFYPNRSVRVYLNGLAQRIFLKVYRSRRTPLGQVLTFWTDELPEEIYRARKAFRLALFLFVLCFGIGMLSCAMDPEFAEVVLGDSYVEMTRANIESGDPMRVYKEKGRFSMFLGITLNNLYVAFLTFALGVFFGLGSIIVLVSNAIMVGCFQYFFIAEGLFWESFLTIWIHGTLEISAIVIAAAAGITMGRGLAFPGTYTRLQAFQQSARRGAKIMLGITPLFVIAGFLEGYLTRQTETPDMVRGLFILLCLSFVLVYFVWYPWFRQRLQLPPPEEAAQRLSTSKPYHLDKGRIKSAGELFSEAFTLFGRHFGRMAALALGAALVYCLIVFGYYHASDPAAFYPFNYESWILNTYNWTLLYASRSELTLLPVAGGVALYTLSWGAFRAIDREAGNPLRWRAAWQLLFGVFLVIMTISILEWWLVFTVGLLLPPALFYSYVCYHENRNPLTAIGRSLELLKGNYFQTIGLFILMLCLVTILFTLNQTALMDLLFQLINWLVIAEQAVLDVWSIRIGVFLTVTIANCCWLLLLLSIGLQYYSAREMLEAPELRERLQQIGQSRRLRGLERE